MTARPPVLDSTAWLLLIALSLVWGASFFFAEVALADLPPVTIVAARMVIGAAGLWVIVAIVRVVLPRDRRTWCDLLVMGLLNNALPFCLIVSSQVWVTGGFASVLNATTPVFGVIAAHVFTTDERLTPNRLAGVVLGFLGVVVLMGPSILGNVSDQIIGGLLLIAAAISYATAGLWGRRLRHLPPVSAATCQASCSMVMLVPLALVVDAPWALPNPSIEVWLSLLGIGLLSTSLAYLMFFAILKRAGGSNVMLVTLMVPPSATLLGVLVLAEPVSTGQLIGMVLICLGLVAIDGRLLRRFRTA
ncbi:MAG: DMT family transporter [Rhodospirillales bacterium]|nr:DMT family transporter [Rhodospirillales bacterium]